MIPKIGYADLSLFSVYTQTDTDRHLIKANFVNSGGTSKTDSSTKISTLNFYYCTNQIVQIIITCKRTIPYCSNLKVRSHTKSILSHYYKSLLITHRINVISVHASPVSCPVDGCG